MNNTDEIIDQIVNGPSYFLQNVSIDNVIFGYHEKELKVLLQHPLDIPKWALPGGFIKHTESLEEAAKRIARDRTGLDNLYLQQYHSFGNPERNKDKEISALLLKKLSHVKMDEKNWMFDYFVSVCFYTLTDFSCVSPNGEYFAEECQWWDILNLPMMIYDHRQMITEALKTLRLHIYHYPIGYELLPERFTLPEIHALYETILGKKLDSRNFSKKLISTGIIKKLDERRKIGPHRSPFLYKFDMEIYNKALEEGMVQAF
jgi:8-oxo-dGTP diphosphatase